MTIQAGSLVTIGPPFSTAFPDSYPVIYVFGDGSAAVMVPGWVQEGATFAVSQGANFAAQFLVDTGNTVDLATLNIPTTALPAPTGLQVTSTSTPSINGTYAYDEVTQARINAVSTYIVVNNKFPAGQTQLPWPDAGGTLHLFTTPALFQSFASAVADFVAALDLGGNPPTTVTIP